MGSLIGLDDKTGPKRAEREERARQDEGVTPLDRVGKSAAKEDEPGLVRQRRGQRLGRVVGGDLLN